MLLIIPLAFVFNPVTDDFFFSIVAINTIHESKDEVKIEPQTFPIKSVAFVSYRNVA